MRFDVFLRLASAFDNAVVASNSWQIRNAVCKKAPLACAYSIGATISWDYLGDAASVCKDGAVAFDCDTLAK